MKKIMATKITEHTLVGIPSKDFPIEGYGGNCFSVKAEDGSLFRIANFGLENLKEAERRGVKWPIEIKPLSDRIAVIHDSRIPDNWYSDSFCEICCPRDLLPLPQLLRYERQIDRGERVEVEHGVMFIGGKRPELPARDYSRPKRSFDREYLLEPFVPDGSRCFRCDGEMVLVTGSYMVCKECGGKEGPR